MKKNNLTFITKYKSISSLPTISLPQFTLIIGKNGSGKSHLLEAIYGGNIKSNQANGLNEDIVLFDSTSIRPNEGGTFSTAEDQNRKEKLFERILISQQQIFLTLQEQAINYGIEKPYVANIIDLVALDESKLEKILQNPQTAASVFGSLSSLITALSKNIYKAANAKLDNELLSSQLNNLLNTNPSAFYETDYDKFFNHSMFTQSRLGPFRQEFGRLFSHHRSLWQKNASKRALGESSNKSDKGLTNFQFVKEHGQAPWELVNEIILECKLDFEIDKPDMVEISPYEPKLTKISTGVEVSFKDLSVGEQVLMSFALCIHNVRDAKQGVVFPKLILLDEVDAHLHPSMIVSMIKIIKNTLITKKGISVILTTHSPTTVALTEEASIYEMDPNGPKIEKCSKNEAISILTENVPTLSVSIENRRQVFVESKSDAKLYDKIYQKYKSVLNHERCLTFIEVGDTTKLGDINSGCAQVKKIVKALCSNGNSTVFGLVDWDNEATGTERVKILSQNVRDGIENLLFDPRLIGIAAVREKRQFCIDKKLITSEDSYISMIGWNESKWQGFVNRVQNFVIGKNKQNKTIKIKYLDGKKLDIRRDYLHCDDHELEKKITSKFGFFLPMNRNPSGLMNHIFDSVLTDHTELLPMDLIETFSSILNQNVSRS